MQGEALMKERIKRLSNINYGRGSVGGTCLATYHVLAAVSAEFQKRYPNIEIVTDMGGFGKANLIERMKKRSSRRYAV